MGLRRFINHPKRTVWLLQELTQFRRRYAVVKFPADRQIGALLALVLAEPARQANRSVQSVALHMLIDGGKILRVPSCEAGAPKANHDFDNAVV
jgi:hypothetical protein